MKIANYGIPMQIRFTPEKRTSISQQNNEHHLARPMALAEDCCAGLNERAPLSDQNGPRGFLQSTAGQLALLGAAIIVLLFFRAYLCQVTRFRSVGAPRPI
jgi:hypothetical protein